jgi:uncharacterized membrane protein
MAMNTPGAATTHGARGPSGQSGPSGPSGGLEVALAHVLQLGTYVSIALVATGSVLLLAGGQSPIEGGPKLELASLPADVLALRPAGFLWLGILGVLATPGLRVVRALLGFARRGETRMAATSAIVLGVIAIGVFVGVTAH